MDHARTEIAVGIVEDQRAVREGLAHLIGGASGFRVAGAWPSMEAALAELAAARPDVLLADIALPGMSGIEGVRRVRLAHPAVQILMLTVYGDSEHVFDAIRAGACGYLLKDTPPARLLEALRELVEGGAPMTPEIARKTVEAFQRSAPPRGDAAELTARERDVLALLAEGESYKTAALALGIALDTVRFHVRHVYEKLHVSSKGAAVREAFRRGWVR